MRIGTDIVRCTDCPTHPVLPTASPIDQRRCARCQGPHRWLPVPHPEDHLCPHCRAECAECGTQLPLDSTGCLCRACNGSCHRCGNRLPQSALQTASAVYPRAAVGVQLHGLLCDACLSYREQYAGLLAALPNALATHFISADVHRLIETQLTTRSFGQLRRRIDRRWYSRFSANPISYPGSGRPPVYVVRDENGERTTHSMDELLTWLIQPSSCTARCEDGWHPDNPDQACLTCQPSVRPCRLRPPQPPSETARTSAAQIRAELCKHPTRTLTKPYIPHHGEGTH